MDRLVGTARLAVSVVVSAALLAALAPLNRLAAHLDVVLADPQAAVDAHGADAVVLTLVAALAWAVLGWLVAVSALISATTLPGRVGAVAAMASRLVAPVAARRILAGVLGVTLLTGLGAGAAGAAPPAAPRTPTPVGQLDLDWPAEPAPPPGGAAEGSPAPTAPREEARSVSPADARRDRAQRGTGARHEAVVVRGDTLWTIAARQLGPGATDEQVAREWPRWWARNRAVIGTDPDLILPGQRLTPPDR